MNTYWGVEVCFHAVLTSALDGDEWSNSRPDRFTRGGKAPGTHWTGGWVGLHITTLYNMFANKHFKTSEGCQI
jgi:hypothetical protein